MAVELAKKVGIKKKKGYLYFVDKEGDISRAQFVTRGSTEPVKKPQKVKKLGFKRESGWLYFIDKQGNISRTRKRYRKRNG